MHFIVFKYLVLDKIRLLYARLHSMMQVSVGDCDGVPGSVATRVNRQGG